MKIKVLALILIQTLFLILTTCSNSSGNPMDPEATDNTATSGQTYTLTYDANGGTNAPAVVTGIKEGQSVTLSDGSGMTMTHNTFTGWRTAAGYFFAGGSTYTMGKADVTLFAQWSSLPVLFFDTYGGTPSIEPISKSAGSTYSAPANPTKTGYTFSGWIPALPATIPSTNFTVTAQWTINSYTITFDSDDGSAVSPINQNYGTAIAAPSDPTKSGYNFTGWSPALPATMPASNLTLTAQWTLIQYTITFDSAGGTAISPITLVPGASVTTPANPTKIGYIFTEWSPAVPATMPTYNLTVTAQWELPSFSAVSTFPADGSTNVVYTNGASVKITFNEDVKAGTGNIILTNTSNNRRIIVAVTDTSKVTFTGSTMEVKFSPIIPGKAYAVRIESTAVQNLAGTAQFAGISDATTWNFQYFSPKNVAAQLFWFDARDPAGNSVMPTHGNTLSTWADRSGGSRNGTASGTPIWVSNGSGTGLPSVNMWGSMFYTIGTEAPLLGKTIFIVANPTTNADNYLLGSSAWFAVSVSKKTSDNLRVNAGSAGSFNTTIKSGSYAAVADNAFGLLSSSIPTVSKSYVVDIGSTTAQDLTIWRSDDTSLTPAKIRIANATSFAPNLKYIGRHDLANKNYYGTISEILIFNSQLNSTQTAEVENYLKSKWGL